MCILICISSNKIYRLILLNSQNLLIIGIVHPAYLTSFTHILSYLHNRFYISIELTKFLAMKQKDITIIDLVVPTIICSICGECDLSKWGIPIDSETSEIVSNDFEGDWCGIPVCRDCFAKHENGEFVGHYTRF